MRRRSFLRAGSAAALAGLAAGCASPNEGSSEPTGTDQSTSTTSGGQTDTTGGDQTTTSGSYSVSMEPMGAVEFDSVPQTATIYCPGYADMLVALGHADAVESVGIPSRYHTGYYAELDGVDLDKSEITALYDGGIDRETFLALGSDVHVVDPHWLLNNFSGLSRDDVDQIGERVAPFLGNTVFRRTDAWHDGYRYYTMYEAFEKMAELFRETERFEAFQSFHDETVDAVRAKLPSERPSGALVWGGSNQPESFSPYFLSGQGTNKKQFHDLGVHDALKNSGVEALSTGQRSKIDYETLLEIDPDALFVRGHEGKTREEFANTVLAFMKDHETASRLSAVQDEMVFRGGPIYEGPIQNLFLTERFATLLYPDTYSGKLFDRSELASIITP